jgi:hypothetical protein
MARSEIFRLTPLVRAGLAVANFLVGFDLLLFLFPTVAGIMLLSILLDGPEHPGYAVLVAGVWVWGIGSAIAFGVAGLRLVRRGCWSLVPQCVPLGVGAGLFLTIVGYLAAHTR